MLVDHLQREARREYHAEMVADGADLDDIDEALRAFDREHAGYSAAVLRLLLDSSLATATFH